MTDQENAPPTPPPPSEGNAQGTPEAEFDRPEPKVRHAGAAQAYGMACHLATLVTYCFRLAWFNIPGVLAPLLLWQLVEAHHKSAAYHAKEAFNFQLNVLGWFLIAKALGAFCCLGDWAYWVIYATNAILTIAAAIAAAEGERFRYPGIVRVLDTGR